MRTTLATHPLIEQPLLLELKVLSSNLSYAFLGAKNTLPMIITANLMEIKVEALLSILQKFKRAMGLTIMGIPPGICTYKIQLKPNSILII